MYQKELLKGSTETLLLSLLAREAMYGYQLVKEMERRSSGYFRFREGTLYPALHRLERRGLVQGKWQEAPNGMPRRYYYITPRGRRVLAERLAEWERFSRAVNLVTLAEAF
jgi:DNA-binding PadR family transcriptional regulator